MTRNAAFAALLLGFSVAVSSSPVLADSSIAAAGSTALLPLVKDAAEAYQAAHKDVKISVSGGGSGTGINQVAAKAVDIGDSDIVAPADKVGLVDNKVCAIGFSVIAHPGIGVKSLSKKQIQDIFAGVVTNWNQVGGANEKIVIINRTRGSGTRVVFEKTLMGTAKVSESGLTEDATGTVLSVVKQTPGAVSYAAFSGTKAAGPAAVFEVQIDGVDPIEANVITGKYPFWSYEHMYTYGPATGEVKNFIEFVRGANDLLKKNYFTKIADMKVTENDR